MRKQLEVLPFLGLVNSSVRTTLSTRSPASLRTTSHRSFSVRPISGSQKLTSCMAPQPLSQEHTSMPPEAEVLHGTPPQSARTTKYAGHAWQEAAPLCWLGP